MTREKVDSLRVEHLQREQALRAEHQRLLSMADQVRSQLNAIGGARQFAEQLLAEWDNNEPAAPASAGSGSPA